MISQFLANSTIGSRRATDATIVREDIDTQALTSKTSRPRSIRWLVLCGVLLSAAIGVGTAFAVDHFRARALANTERELTNTALLLSRHLDQELKQLELVQANLVESIRSLGVVARDDVERRMAGQDVHLMLKSQISTVPYGGRLSVMDADGNMLNSSYAWPVPAVNVADREYFKALKSTPQLTTLLSEPVRSRIDGGWSIILARKVSGPTGEFLGVIVGGIQLTHFEKFFASVALGEGASISMFMRDGTLLARHPPAPSKIGTNFITGPLEQHRLFAEEQITTRVPGRVDGQDRLVSARRLTHFPIVVMPTTTVSAALVDWRHQTRTFVGVAGLSVLVIGALLFLIVRQLSREHAYSGQRLVVEKQRLDTAVNNMTQGLLLFDASARIVVVNRRYIDMYRLSRDVVRPGCLLRTLIEHRKETGSFSGDVGDYCSAILRDVGDRKRTQNIVQTADGRSIQVVDRPLEDGGWVCTHEDITEQQRLHAELQQSSEQLNLALENMSQGLAMFDADQRIVIANDHFAEMYGQTSGQVKLGTPLKEIIEHRIAHGLYVGTTADEVLARMRERVARGTVSHMTSRMGDGRHDHRFYSTAARWWMGDDSPRRQRARKTQRQPRRGSKQHGAGTCHVRQRSAAGALQRAVCRNVSCVAEPSGDRDHGARAPASLRGQRLLCR